MKVLVALCAVVACAMAKPYVGLAYSAPTSYSYSTSVVSVSKPAAPVAYAAPAPVAYAAPAPVSYVAAPAPVAYAAAPAPVAYAAAPAPVAYAAAPAPAVVAAPAPVEVAAPAPVAYAAPAPAPVEVVAPAPAVVAAPAPAPVAYAAPAPAVVAAPAPVAYAAPAPAVVPAPVHAVKSQYHAQNEVGEASYGHAEPGQTHNAVQDAHGNKIGSFSYVNPHGEVLRTDYVADGAGYRVASNALPAAPIVTPIDTPEVAAAKETFFHDYAAKAAETHARRRRSAVLVQTPASTAPLTYAPAYYAPAPVAYAAAPAPVAYAAAPAPVTYAVAPAPAVVAAPAPISYAAAAPAVAPITYAAAAPAVAPIAYAAAPSHAVRPATLTTVVNNPGHAVSYRVD